MKRKQMSLARVRQCQVPANDVRSGPHYTTTLHNTLLCITTWPHSTISHFLFSFSVLKRAWGLNENWEKDSFCTDGQNLKMFVNYHLSEGDPRGNRMQTKTNGIYIYTLRKGIKVTDILSINQPKQQFSSECHLKKWQAKATICDFFVWFAPKHGHKFHWPV